MLPIVMSEYHKVVLQESMGALFNRILLKSFTGKLSAAIDVSTVERRYSRNVTYLHRLILSCEFLGFSKRWLLPPLGMRLLRYRETSGTNRLVTRGLIRNILFPI